MKLKTQVEIRDKVFCISFNDNALRKGMNPSLFPPGMSKL